MTKLSKRLPDDNKKLVPLVREISWSENLVIISSNKDNLEREFHLTYCDLPKVQPPLVAQIGWIHNPIVLQRCHAPLEGGLEYISTEAAMRAATIKKNFEELGV